MSLPKKEDKPVKLMDRSLAAGCAAKIPPHVLASLLGTLPENKFTEERLLTRIDSNEDAAIVSLPPDVLLVQTLDFFTPVVNDPFAFGQIAAANALSDVYAMGGEPWTAMNIVCFPAQDMPDSVLQEILAGGAAKLEEAGCALVGGHSIRDDEVKYGLSVTGIVKKDCYATNSALLPGQLLLLTKALGTGLLSTAIKVGLEGWEEIEANMVKSAARLNKTGARAIRELGIKAASDITGFGLGGHLLEMAEASDVDIHIELNSLPLLPRALELCEMGFLPAGSHANKAYRLKDSSLGPDLNPYLLDMVFDAQTSGGLILAVFPEQFEKARTMLEEAGDLATLIGFVDKKSGSARLHIN